MKIQQKKNRGGRGWGSRRGVRVDVNEKLKFCENAKNSGGGGGGSGWM